jgi:cytochrome c oxidase cbb3-type subunit III
MWNIRSGGKEPGAFEKSSARELKAKRESVLFKYPARGDARNVLTPEAVLIRGVLAAVIVCAASSAAQAKKDQSGPTAEPVNPAPADDFLRSIYPKLTPNQDPASVTRGKAIYEANCAFCHGKNATGGNSGPDLVRSLLLNHDEKGELIGPVIRQGRVKKGMPSFTLANSQISDLVAFLHQRNRDARLRFTYKIPNVAIGNAAAGKTYFDSHCAACHSASRDLAGVAKKYPGDELQQRWLDPGEQRVEVTVTLPSGQKYVGKLEHLDEFSVSLHDTQGIYRSFVLTPEVRVEIQDPLDGHRKLLEQLSDGNMHDVTTYLETLK